MAVLLAGVAVNVALVVVVLARLQRIRPGDGEVVLVNRTGRWLVTRRSVTVVPPFQSARRIELSAHTLVVRCPGGLRCRDGVRADVRVVAHIRVGDQPDDVLAAARCLGVEALTDPSALRGYLAPRLIDAARCLAAQLPARELLAGLDQLGEELGDIIGRDLNGLRLDSVGLEPDQPDDTGVSMGVFR